MSERATTAIQCQDGSATSERLFSLPGMVDTIDEGLTDADAIITEAVAEHGPIECMFLLLSGGNDSMVLLDACEDYADKVVHINTGIGIPETNEFVRQVCADRGLELVELSPPRPYEDLVLNLWDGFPGPGHHLHTYTRLKERCIEQLLRDHRTSRGQRFGLVTGVRTDESARRMMTSQEPVTRRGGQVWIAPLTNWPSHLMRQYRTERNLPVNPVTEHLHMSGECLCGAFARPGELDHIGFFYPEFVERIRDLERRAREKGCHNTVWGERPPERNAPAPGPMCNQCVLWDGDSGQSVVTVDASDNGSERQGGDDS